jgi:MarR family transcriptional regulator for hemolysin
MIEGRANRGRAPRRPLTAVQGSAGAAPHDGSLGRLLALTAKSMREWFDARLAEHGGSLVTWIVLSQAIDGPVRPSQRQLADRVGIGGATLVHHLDRLEAEGLVERRRDPDDRRVTRVYITDGGRARHLELSEVAAAVDAELRGLMDAKAETVFRDVLHRIGAHVAPPVPAATETAPTSEPPAAASSTAR